jgi:Glucosamine 6-phosphate synthetase, contains amidotransferase and phosphosugar isomerase domains
MCGIFGYIGKVDNAAKIILEGLKDLEYRGYDSWGIALKKEGKFLVKKHVGKIGNAKPPKIKSNFGIGHTRWATHGGVSKKNAHPHLDCTAQIAVVHNGIIENYEEIKKDLIEKGHTFVSETDTEVLPHLIEENLKKEGFSSSVRDTFNRIVGMNAFVAAYSKSQEIIGVKNGSPLIIGLGNGSIFISSDSSSLLPHTKKLLFIEDNQMVILSKDNLQLLSLPEGKKIKPRFEIVEWTEERSKRKGFAHFMLKEIYEQPRVIRNIAKNYDSQAKELARIIKKARGTFFIGAGTAFHACIGGVYLFSAINRHHINTAFASEFNYLEEFLNEKSLVVAFSQSGETIDVIEPLKKAKENGAKIVAITNSLGSTIYRMADVKVLLGAG